VLDIERIVNTFELLDRGWLPLRNVAPGGQSRLYQVSIHRYQPARVFGMRARNMLT
jgi:hypothetical protein